MCKYCRIWSCPSCCIMTLSVIWSDTSGWHCAKGWYSCEWRAKSGSCCTASCSAAKSTLYSEPDTAADCRASLPVACASGCWESDSGNDKGVAKGTALAGVLKAAGSAPSRRASRSKRARTESGGGPTFSWMTASSSAHRSSNQHAEGFCRQCVSVCMNMQFVSCAFSCPQHGFARWCIRVPHEITHKSSLWSMSTS